jgi:clan AA aspartic protease (TIGR02281 family)
MKHLISITIFLAAFLVADTPFGRIYIWTDSEGVKNFSQEPPPDNVSDVMVHDELRYDPSSDAKSLREEPVPNDQPPNPSRRKISSGNQETRIALDNNVILIPATVRYNGREIETKLVLDTGASSTILHKPVAARLGIQLSKNTQIRTASGEFVDAQAINLDALRVGPHTMEELRTLIILHQGPQTNHQGLLGLNFLGNYPHSIDLRKMVIRWGDNIPATGP